MTEARCPHEKLLGRLDERSESTARAVREIRASSWAALFGVAMLLANLLWQRLPAGDVTEGASAIVWAVVGLVL